MGNDETAAQILFRQVGLKRPLMQGRSNTLVFDKVVQNKVRSASGKFSKSDSDVGAAVTDRSDTSAMESHTSSQSSTTDLEGARTTQKNNLSTSSSSVDGRLDQFKADTVLEVIPSRREGSPSGKVLVESHCDDLLQEAATSGAQLARLQAELKAYPYADAKY